VDYSEWRYLVTLTEEESELLYLLNHGFTKNRIADLWDVDKSKISRMWKSILKKVKEAEWDD